MTESHSFDSDPQFDSRLAEWGRSLRPGEEPLSRLQAVVLREFESAPPPLPSVRATLATKERPRRGGWILAPVVLCLGIASWVMLRPDVGHRRSEASIAFTAEDVRSREDLVCELDRVFEHQLTGVRQQGATVSLDTVSESGDRQTLRLVLRFVLQDRVAGEWTTVDQEEVMGPVDDQFRFATPSRLDMDCWSHLLPDQSLWLESVVAPFGGEEVRLAAQFQINHPQEFWSSSTGPLPRRVLVVYQLLNPCSAEVI